MIPKIIDKECKKHGNTRHVFQKSRGYYRCSKCLNIYVIARRVKMKKILVEESGGKCSRCGYNKSLAALQFHHTDRKTKSFGISGISIGIDRVRKESKKCILVCANCHAEIEEELRN